MSDLVFDKPADVPIADPVKISVDWLKLDPKNPRLVLTPNLSDEEIVVAFYHLSDLKELIQSISENGYMDIEPLIVWLEPGNSKFTVLEGNRRLATILLFRNKKLLDSINGNNENGVSIDLPKLTDGIRSTLEKVTVYRVKNRNDSLQFVGFKHINGTARWPSYAKAKFAADWYDEHRKEKNRREYLSHIAGMIGDNHNTVKRMVFAIYVIEQADKENLFSIYDCWSGRFGFSHLYVALTRSSYMSFLGLDEGWTKYDPEPNPVPEKKLSHLKEILLWIYGSKNDSIKPIIQSQNPDIRKLGEVISRDDSLVLLRATRDLEYAYESVTPEEEVFRNFLVGSERELVKTMKNLNSFDGAEKSLLITAEKIKQHARIIYDTMNKKVRERDEKKFYEDEDESDEESNNE